MSATYTVGSGQSYSTFALALAAVPGNLSTQGLQWIAPIAGTYTENVTVSGFTNASASDYIQIAAQVGNSHSGLFSAGAIINGSGNNITLTIGINYTRVQEIAVTNNSTVTNGGNPAIYGTGINMLFERLLVKNTAGKNSAFYISGAGSATIRTCETWRSNTGTTPTTWSAIICYTNVTVLVQNSVLYGYYGGVDNYSNLATLVTVTNTASIKHASSGGNDFTGTITQSYNASSDATASGTGSLTSVSNFGFISLVTPDFHITTSSVLKAAGTDLSGTFTTDIDNQTITTWPIGADFKAADAITGSSTLSFSQSGTLSSTIAAVGTSSLSFNPVSTLTGLGVITGSSNLSFSGNAVISGVQTIEITGASTLNFSASASISGLGVTLNESLTGTLLIFDKLTARQRV